MRFAALIIGVLTGCGVPEDNYPAVAAETLCVRLQECALGEYEEEFSSHEDCRDEVSDDIEDDWSDEDCDYDPAEAGRCVRRIRSMGCEEFVDGGASRACDLVYDCTGN